jgi:hypothetical protein
MSMTYRSLLESTSQLLPSPTPLLYVFLRLSDSLRGTPSIGGLLSPLSFSRPTSKFARVASAPTVDPVGAPDAAGCFHGHGRAPLRATGKVVRGLKKGPGHRMDAVLPLQKAHIFVCYDIGVFLLISEYQKENRLIISKFRNFRFFQETCMFINAVPIGFLYRVRRRLFFGRRRVGFFPVG